MILKDIDVIFWDLDGVFYKQNDEINPKAFTKAQAEALKHFGADGSIEEIIQGIDEEYKKDKINFFTNITKRYGVDRAVFDDNYANFLHCDSLEENKYISSSLRKLKQRHCIITQAPLNWTKKVLKAVGCFEMFKNNFITSNKTMDMHKAASTEIFDHACENMGVDPKRAVMIEDSAKKLKTAKKAGMTTILFNGSKYADEPHIDYQFKDMEDFVKHINENENEFNLVQQTQASR